SPMRFEWRREGPAQACGANCRVWISATGYITADTPREFETFAKDPNARGAVLVLDSDGGSVLGTLALGRAIRSLGMITTIGKTTVLRRLGKASRGRRYRPVVAGRLCWGSHFLPGRAASCPRGRQFPFTESCSGKSG